MENNNKQKIEKIIVQLLEKMDIRGAVDVQEEEEFLSVKIDSDEAGLLIGQGGRSLEAFQFLARAIANKDAGEKPIIFIIDVNDYRKNRLELLKDMVMAIAKDVAMQKRARVLEPMASYERRAIHVALRDFAGIKTESQGEGPERRVIISPASESLAL